MDPWLVNFARALAVGTWGPLPEPAALEQAATSTAITDSVSFSVTDRRPCTGLPPDWCGRAPPPGAARGHPGRMIPSAPVRRSFGRGPPSPRAPSAELGGASPPNGLRA